MTNPVRSFEEFTSETRASAGGKGGALARMAQAGLPVPDGFVILPEAFQGEVLTAEAWAQVRGCLERLRGADTRSSFAVRSSAMAEDSAQASFAGEFESVLNVRTDDDVLTAIKTVYLSRHSERVKAYSQARDLAHAHRIAVIVQRLVHAECSGVLFTANPVTGERGQAMINAAWGLGEAIVGGLVTPDTISVEKSSGRILGRETADKPIMTVLNGTGTKLGRVPERQRSLSVLSDEQAIELVQLGIQIEDLFGVPMDIEWTLADGKFAIVQARPITALPEPEPTVPLTWKLPKGAYSAMRNNIVELMADPLTPLFSTLGLSAVHASMNRQMTAFMGSTDIMPPEPIIIVNGYAYYNGSIRFGAFLKIMFGSVGIARRMFTGAVERWTETGRPTYVAKVARWEGAPWQNLPATKILLAARELSEAAIDAYMALVSGVIPAAWISEGLFTLVYRLLKRRDDPIAATYLMGFDSVPIQAEKALYDLAGWTCERPELAAFLIGTPTPELEAHLRESGFPAGVGAEDWHAWREHFHVQLQNYGHMIYDLDFASPVPADNPGPLLETLKLFLSGQGVNPYDRQKAAAERRERATQAMEKRLRGLRLRLFRKHLARAQRYAPLREDGLADVGLGYPLLRRMLRELGRRFADTGIIDQADDIFWLEQDEIEVAAEALDQGEISADLSGLVPVRKAWWQSIKKLTPPMMLPQIRIFGVDLGEIRSGGGRKARGDTLRGVAASPGSVTAPACVITGPEDFARMRTGDVLVAPLTTPAWTPLFVRASAVVTDVGGPLSHGSIVAREYGIPAVLGTGAATKRIHTGQLITVNGAEGVVQMHLN